MHSISKNMHMHACASSHTDTHNHNVISVYAMSVYDIHVLHTVATLSSGSFIFNTSFTKRSGAGRDRHLIVIGLPLIISQASYKFQDILTPTVRSAWTSSCIVCVCRRMCELGTVWLLGLKSGTSEGACMWVDQVEYDISQLHNRGHQGIISTVRIAIVLPHMNKYLKLLLIQWHSLWTNSGNEGVKGIHHIYMYVFLSSATNLVTQCKIYT